MQVLFDFGVPQSSWGHHHNCGTPECIVKFRWHQNHLGASDSLKRNLSCLYLAAVKKVDVFLANIFRCRAVEIEQWVGA